MKIVILNLSGNVGKTTLSRHVFQPRMDKVKLISIESVNSDGQEDVILKGNRFTQLMQAISILDSAIVDVGASNSEDFLWAMEQQYGSHEDFDIFVLPVIGTAKQIADTIKTIDALTALGVEADRIKVVFNSVSPGDTLDDTFAAIYAHQDKHESFSIVDNAVIQMNELFPLLVKNELTITQALDDPTDYRKLIRETSDDNQKMALQERLGIKRLATGVNPKLQAVFDSVTA